MKKIYSIITLLVVLFAMPVSAQVESVTELFGKYHFTATADVKDASMSEYFSNDCEVEITADPRNIFPGQIKGLAGAEGVQDIYKLTSDGKGIIIRNPNGNYDVWGHGLYMANADGQNPYYGTQEEMYGNIVYSYDSETKTFNLPDFTLITCDDWSKQQANIVVKFTNVKMVLTQGETIVVDDMTSDYHFTCGQGNYDYNHDSDISLEWDLKLTATNESFTQYTADLQIPGFNMVTIPAKFDGQSMVFTLDNVFLDDAKTIYLSSLYGGSTTATFSMMKAGKNLSMSSGFAILKVLTPETEEDPTYENLQWYLTGIAKNLNASEDEVSYAGKYTATATLEMDMTEGKVPTLGDIEIVYNEMWDMYLITKFLGYDVENLNQGGFVFTPDKENPLKGTIDCTAGYSELDLIGENADGNYEYLSLRDGNLFSNPIPVTFDSDGNFTIGEFTIAKTVYNMASYGFDESAELQAWYSGLTATKQQEEPVEKGTLAGKYTTSTVLADNYGHDDCPANGESEITYDEDQDIYLLNKLLGFDLYYLNYGGLPLTVDAEDPHKATLKCGEIAMIEAGSIYWSLRDMNALDKPLEVVISDNGDITIKNVCIAVTTMDPKTWAMEFKEGYAYYSSITLKKDDGTGISNVEFVPMNKKDGIYGIDGSVRSSLSKGFNIVVKNGESKTILVK